MKTIFYGIILFSSLCWSKAVPDPNSIVMTYGEWKKLSTQLTFDEVKFYCIRDRSNIEKSRSSEAKKLLAAEKYFCQCLICKNDYSSIIGSGASQILAQKDWLQKCYKNGDDNCLVASGKHLTCI